MNCGHEIISRHTRRLASKVPRLATMEATSNLNRQPKLIGQTKLVWPINSHRVDNLVWPINLLGCYIVCLTPG